MLKRAIDGGEDAPVPSEMTRARVMAQARGELAERARAASAPAQRSRRIALVATAAAALVLGPLLWRVTAPRVEPVAPAVDVATPETPLPAGATRAVDTARATPENLRFL
jgi:hypothetical protein